MQGPPLSFDAGESSFAPSEDPIVQEEITSLLNKGAIRLIPESQAHFVCSMFLVSKKDGSFRPVLNLKPLNSHTTPKHFKMEGLPVVKDALQEGDFMCTVDLKDAFLHVPLHPSHQRFFQFRWQNQLYQYTATPFGWSRSPQWFQAFTSHIAKICRSQFNFRLVVYLDDFLVLGASKNEAEKNTRTLLLLLEHFGFTPNWKKSTLIAAQSREFLGTVVDSVQMTLSVPPEKLVRYRQAAKRLARRAKANKPVHLHNLQSVVGQLQSCAQCIPLCRMRMAGLLRALRDALHFCQPPKLDQEAIEDLDSWSLLAAAWNGKSFRVVSPDFLFTTDAGPVGYGAHCTVFPHPMVTVQGRFLSLTKLDSTNEKELQAILFAFRSFRRHFQWSHCHVRVVTDSATSMLYINKTGGRVPSLMAITKRILKYALEFKITLTAEFIGTKANWRADDLSRKFEHPQYELRLKKDIFASVDQFFGPHQVDTFAAVENHQLPLYISWRPDPFSMYADLFSRKLPQGSLFCFPPFCLILRLLNKIRAEFRQATVLVPFWVSRPWWPVLLDMLVEPPAILPPNSLKSPRGIFKRSPIQQHPLLACSLSGDVALTSAFQATRLSTHWDATSRIQQMAARRSRAMSAIFPSTRYSELQELTQRRSSPTLASCPLLRG